MIFFHASIDCFGAILESRMLSVTIRPWARVVVLPSAKRSDVLLVVFPLDTEVNSKVILSASGSFLISLILSANAITGKPLDVSSGYGSIAMTTYYMRMALPCD